MSIVKRLIVCTAALVNSCSDDAGQVGDGTRAPAGTEQSAFELVASSASLEVPRGGQAVLVLSTTSTSDAVLFPPVTGAPPGVEVQVTPVAKTNAAVVTIRAAASVAPGPSSLVFNARAGEATASANVALTITEAETAFALSLAPSALSVRRGSSVAVGVDLARAPGFAEPVEIALVDPAKQLDAQAFTITGGGSSGALTITPRPDAAIGKHPVLVRARSKTAERTAALDVDVTRRSGSLDTTFGPGGVKHFTGFVELPLDDKSAVFLEDGSVVFSGTFVPGILDAACVSKLTPDLRVDIGFGTGGTGSATFGGIIYLPRDIVSLSDGRIGSFGQLAGSGETAIAVFDKYGKLDKAFDGDGEKVHTFMPGQNHPGAITASLNGMLFATSLPLRVARLGANGAFDTTFGAGQGWVEHDTYPQRVRLIATDPVTGKISVAGKTFDGKLSVARLLANGALDTSYGVGGFAILNVGPFGEPSRMVFADNSALVVYMAGNELPKVARVTGAGMLDPAWPNNPVVVSTRYFYRGILAVHPDGKILVGDVTWDGAVRPLILRRLNADGTFDLAFDAGNPTFVVGSQGDLLATRVVDDDRFEVFGVEPGGVFVARYFR